MALNPSNRSNLEQLALTSYPLHRRDRKVFLNHYHKNTEGHQLPLRSS